MFAGGSSHAVSLLRLLPCCLAGQAGPRALAGGMPQPWPHGTDTRQARTAPAPNPAEGRRAARHIVAQRSAPQRSSLCRTTRSTTALAHLHTTPLLSPTGFLIMLTAPNLPVLLLSTFTRSWGELRRGAALACSRPGNACMEHWESARTRMLGIEITRNAHSCLRHRCVAAMARVMQPALQGEHWTPDKCTHSASLAAHATCLRRALYL